VGKTWLVRSLAESFGKKLIELNFEKQPQLSTLFLSNNPSEILTNLSLTFNQEISPQSHLLFLDEIQAAPEILSKLRWFAENLPELPVIAAGSLLEFVLEQHMFSMPVGRISYMHLEPLSFDEFLLARGQQQLFEYLKSYVLSSNLPLLIHQKLMEFFKEYIVVGGMPVVVQSWVTDKSLNKVNQISHDLLATYRDDFARYKGRLPIDRLDDLLLGIPKQLGQKFVFKQVNSSVNTASLKQALDLLNKARVAHKVLSTAANGLPLGAESNEKFFKEIFLDVGLCSTSLGHDLSEIKSIQEIVHINRGGIAEQVVGQLLRTITEPYMEPRLYYWHREKKDSHAEIDYLVAHRNHLVPVEVKAGSTGSLRSLHLFMSLKQLNLAVRINSDLPSLTPVAVKDHEGKTINYHLLSLPFYLLGQLHHLVDLSLDQI
jgi:predicted AAA+ superfamily ATPase